MLIPLKLLFILVVQLFRSHRKKPQFNRNSPSRAGEGALDFGTRVE